MNRTNQNPAAAAVAGAFVLLAALSSVSCEQSAIFNAISNETKKLDALIQGSPSRIVKIGTELFIANGYLWKKPAVDGSGAWSKTGRPGGLKTRDLAMTSGGGEKLYALTVDDQDDLNSNVTETKVWMSADAGDSWTEIALDAGVSDYTVDSLYVANDVIYAGAHKEDSSKTYDVAYAVLRLNVATLEAADADLVGLDDGGRFAGAAWDGTNTYLATAGLGVFSSADSYAAALSSTTGHDLTGIASLGATTIAVGRDGYTLAKLNAGVAFDADDQDYEFTGALAEYDADDDLTPEYLLLGIRDGTTYGYREIALSAGILPSATPSLSSPDSSSSVLDYDQYAGALGVVPVGRLYQSWESGISILYASTVLQGLWSSADRGDWNLVSE